ncbi:hypothetical protein Tco_0725263 [Tanacetum coccineum]|uniref:Reverse transcriptase Ty1/copia-type domain-containing protein n=1 Tax=Tanacetum coccineum TaxID=301880 RepID=A0ABQ4YEH8_9ASTR
MGLWYPKDSGFELIAYSDADHAGCKDDCKSTSGGLQFLGGKLVSWSSKKQDCTAMSTAEAEYVSLFAFCAQVIWMRTQCLTMDISTIYPLAQQQYAAVVLQIKLCPLKRDIILWMLNKKVDLEHEQCLPESRILRNLIRFIHYGLALQASSSVLWILYGTDTEIPQSGGPPKKVGDEAVHKELGDRVERAATTAASLDAEQDNDFVPPTPHDSPLSRGYTPGSDDGRSNIHKLMAICINLLNMVLSLETSKTAQDLVIKKLKKKVKRLEKKHRARTPGMKLFKIGTSKRKSLDEEHLDVNNAMENVEGDAKTENVEGDAETQGRNTTEQTTNVGDTVNTTSINVSTADPSTSTAGDIFEDEMMTIVDILVAIRSTRPRTTSVMVEPEPTLKNPIKAQIQRDAEIAQRLFEEEQAQFEREQRIARERAVEQ